MITLSRIPDEIGPYIELPDMAELLCQPVFFDIPLEEAYKYATPLQKKIFDSAPLRGDRKYTTVLSEVKMLSPELRCCTGFSKTYQHDPHAEWHIDSIEVGFGGDMKDQFVETDIVHLFSSQVSGMTEFLKQPIEIEELNTDSRYEELHPLLLGKYRDEIIPEKMPANQMVTFTNHLHRATPQTGVEFRYMVRIVETDRERPPSHKFYNPNYITTVMDKNEKLYNIGQERDKIVLYLPKSIQNSPAYRPSTKENQKELEIAKIDKREIKEGLMVDLYFSKEDVTKDELMKHNILIDIHDQNNPSNYFSPSLENIEEANDLICVSLLISTPNMQYIIPDNHYSPIAKEESGILLKQYRNNSIILKEL